MFWREEELQEFWNINFVENGANKIIIVSKKIEPKASKIIEPNTSQTIEQITTKIIDPNASNIFEKIASEQKYI